MIASEQAKREMLNRIDELQADVAEMRQNHDGACKTIAEMHAAATGVPGSAPKRGVVEDVADLRASYEVALVAVTTASQLLDVARADMPNDLAAEWQDIRRIWMDSVKPLLEAAG
jgi:hypothetical protein